MTEITFHTQVGDVPGYVCRLLRKAWRRGARVVVCAPSPLLRQLDSALWTFEPLEFVPHLVLPARGEIAPRLRATPIWLIAPGQDGPTHEVLVNLAEAPAPGYESYERLIEIVGRDDLSAQAGRRRWRHYTERGYRIGHHVVQ